MADTTKLASTFKAWKVTVEVEFPHMIGALKRCEELGLQPRLCGYNKVTGVLFSIVIPCCMCEHPQTDFIEKEMGPFNGVLNHMAVGQLICPPAPEVVPETRPDSLARPTYAVGG